MPPPTRTCPALPGLDRRRGSGDALRPRSTWACPRTPRQRGDGPGALGNLPRGWRCRKPGESSRAGAQAAPVANYVMSHVSLRDVSRMLTGGASDRPWGTGHVTTDIGGDGTWRKRDRDLAQRDRRPCRRARPGHRAGRSGAPRPRRHSGSPAGAGAPGLPRRRPAAVGGARRLARGGLHRAGGVRAGLLRADPRRAARRHQWAPARLGRDRRADDRRAGRPPRSQRRCWPCARPDWSGAPCW